MRLVELLIPKRKRGALEGNGIDLTLVEEESRDEPSVVITFPLPAPAVESVLDDLRDTGVDEDSDTVIVEAETLVSKQFDDLEQRYVQNASRRSRDETQAQAKYLTLQFSTYFVMTVMSVVVTIGYPVETDPPQFAHEIQRRESVHAESEIHLPTGPLVESHRAEVVVSYTERG